MNADELLEELDTKLAEISPQTVIEPESIRPVAIMTRSRRNIGELEKELQKTLDAIKHDSRIPGLLTRLADLHLREADFSRAIVLYETALGLDSNQTEAWINMGLTYLMVGAVKDSVSCLGSALALEPDNVSAQVYIAEAHFQQGELEECNATLDRVLRRSSTHARALMLKGKYYRAMGQLEVAATWLARAVEADSSFLPAL
ncbi:MAG: tetratricopeptide repeat protein, partial [Candidatus Thorarchaeota archaeon]